MQKKETIVIGGESYFTIPMIVKQSGHGRVLIASRIKERKIKAVANVGGTLLYSRKDTEKMLKA